MGRGCVRIKRLLEAWECGTTSVDSGVAELLLDAQQLVVLSNALATEPVHQS